MDGPSAILIKTIPHSRGKLFKCYCNSPVKVGGSIVDIKACADFFIRIRTSSTKLGNLEILK